MSDTTDILRDALRDARDDDVPRTVGVFITTFTIGMALYGIAVVSAMLLSGITVDGPGGAVTPDTGLVEGLGILAEELANSLWDNREYLLMVVVPAVPAALVHTRLPEHTVDKYHRFGKAFAMFATVNLTLSAMFLYFQYPPELGGFVPWFILNFSLASAFLPGPYIGIVLASRWLGGGGDD